MPGFTPMTNSQNNLAVFEKRQKHIKNQNITYLGSDHFIFMGGGGGGMRGGG